MGLYFRATPTVLKGCQPASVFPDFTRMATSSSPVR